MLASPRLGIRPQANFLSAEEAAALTIMLYSGEPYVQQIAMQYLRARFYDAASGRFNRLDPFFGNLDDPQSLHKYFYVHGDPVQGIDLSGLSWSLSTTLQYTAAVGAATALSNVGISAFSVGAVSDHVSKRGVIPDGVMFSIAAGYAARGFQAGGSFSLYFDFTTQKLYYMPAGEGGLSPLSGFKSQSGKVSWGITVGAAWNTQSVDDLGGWTATATWPIFLMRLMMKGNPFSQDQWINFMMTLSRYVKGANIKNNRHGSVSLARGIGNGAAVTSVGFKNYNFSSTTSYTWGPYTVIDRSLPDLIKDALDQVKPLIPLSKDALDTPEEIAAVVHHIDNVLNS